MLISCNSERNNGHDFITSTGANTKLGPGNWEVGLISASVCYGWPNISPTLGNNIIKYRTSGIAEWKTITIPEGIYTIGLLNDYVKAIMRVNTDYSAGEDARTTATTDDIYYINLGANPATGRVLISVSNSYQLDLSASKIYEMLGYLEGTVINTDGDFESVNVPDFNRGVNQVQIRCSLVRNSSSLVNGETSNVLYSFQPSGSPYEIMRIQPSQPIYLDLAGGKIDKIYVQITDQDGKLLTTGNERTSILLNIKKD